jgi:hypothetical protein
LNTVDSTTKTAGVFDLFYNAAISNNIESIAHSGDALVGMNTLAGSALSGSASALTNIINLLQSSWNTLADSFSTFTQNLFGNIVGDLTLNPGSGATNVTTDTTVDTDVNISENTAIDNTITLDASSGDASVVKNTSAGDAGSGDATAVANIVNAINSSIAANKSFLGMLNIFGDLDGDILLPQNLIQTLLAANAVGTLDTSNVENASVLSTFNSNQAIHNDVDLTATSGTASVTNNTQTRTSRYST